MMTMPYRMETAYTRIPYSNIVLVAIISLVYFLIAREMGSMRITNLCQESLKSADLKISYAVGPTKAVKQLHYDVEKEKLVVQ